MKSRPETPPTRALDELDELDEVPEPEAARRAFRRGFVFGAGCVVVGVLGLALSGFVVLGVLMQAGVIPDSAALPAEEIPPATLEFLLENGIIEEGESVLYFYSDGVLSLREDGNLFTDGRVISYVEDGDELYVDAASYAEIAAIEPELSAGLFATSAVTIEREDGTWFRLLVSNEDRRDVDFVDLLVATWERRR